MAGDPNPNSPHRYDFSKEYILASCEGSLRRLQTRFKDQLGRTILQEINGRRVTYAQMLLKTTNKKIHLIAAECGFGGSVKMIRVFNQYVGTSPKRYRKELRRTELPDISAAKVE